MTTPSLTVIVCIHNALEDVKLCLTAISKADYEGDMSTILIDDGSNDPTAEYLQTYAANTPNVTLIRRDTAKGYTNAANTGLQANKSDICILLNSDTIAPRRAFQKIVGIFSHSPDIGVVGPLSNAASWQSVPKLSNTKGGWCANPLPIGMSIDDLDHIVEKAAQELPSVIRTPLANGFCFAIKRSAYEKIGYFDEKYFPRGYGEEDDFCIRAVELGIGVAIAVNTFVYHAKSKSFGSKERAKLSAAGQIALKKRHGEERLARAVETMRLNPYLSFMRKAVMHALSAQKQQSKKVEENA